MAADLPLDSRRLLEHIDWVQHLARSLVRDPDQAEDLAQEAYVAALRSPAPAPGAMRAWLATIVRHMAQRLSRRDAHRRHGEHAISRLEAFEEADLVEAAQEHERLVHQVLALREPQRSTVLLRYYRSLTPSQIAELRGEPLATVKTRLRRALVELRTRLGADGERRLSLFLGLSAGTRRLSGRLELSAPASSASLAWSAGLALVGVAALFLFVQPGRSLDLRPAAAPELAHSATDAGLVVPDLRAPRSPAVGSDAGDAGAAPSAERAAPEVRTLLGRTLDPFGRPVPGVRVSYFNEADEDGEQAPSTVSGNDGSFSIDARALSGYLRSTDPAYVGLLDAAVHPAPRAGPVTLVVAERRRLRGRVQDPSGQPIEGATLSLTLAFDPRALLDAPSFASFPTTLVTRSAAGGHFDLRDRPAQVALTLRVERVGYRPYTASLPRTPGPALQIVTLERLPAVASALRGEVLDPAGRPVSGAWIACLGSTARSDDLGRFQYDPGPGWEQAELFGLHPEHGSGRLELRRADEGLATLVLDTPSVEILGRVLDAEGRPLERARIWIDEGTPFGSTWHRAAGPSARLESLVEDLLGRRQSTRFTRTAADGHFRLDGLLEREYTLHVEHPRDLTRTRLRAWGGTRGLRVTLEAEERVPVAGTLRADDGSPIAGARILAGRLERDARGALRPRAYGATTLSDASGAFDLGLLVRDDLVLLPRAGFAFDELHHVVAEGEDTARLELRLSRLCGLRVEAPGLGADRFLVLDAQGEPLWITERSGFRYERRKYAPLEGGTHASPEGVSARAHTLVLFAGRRELARAPLNLDPERLNTLRLP